MHVLLSGGTEYRENMQFRWEAIAIVCTRGGMHACVRACVRTHLRLGAQASTTADAITQMRTISQATLANGQATRRNDA